MPQLAEVPRTPSNGEFLHAIFGEQYTSAHVASFTLPPDDIKKDQRVVWAGRHFGDGSGIHPNANNYFVISEFFDLVDDNLRVRHVRRKAQFKAGYCVVVDDVGTKILDTRRLPLPSWRLETSPGNEQWGYILNEPCTDQLLFSGTLAGMVARGLSVDGKDPGMTGVTRYVRLPVGCNRKSKYGIMGVACRMNDWAPGRRYAIEQLLAGFDISRDEAIGLGHGSNGTTGRVAAPADDPVLQALEKAGMYFGPKESNGESGWHHITCPWLATHSDGDDSGTAIQALDGGGYKFVCHHGHCDKHHSDEVLGWLRERGLLAMPFEPLPEEFVVASAPATFNTPLDLSGYLTPIPHLIKRTLPAGALCMLWADSGVGKSFLALDWALCIRYGRHWNGFKATKGDVLYLAGEGRSGIAKRVAAWHRHHGMSDANLNTGGAFHVNALETVVPFDSANAPKVTLNRHFDLVIIDTVNRWSSCDENKADEIANWLGRVHELAIAAGGTKGPACVLLIHHSRKDGNQYRGSTALRAAVDVEFAMMAGESGILNLEHRKSKDDQPVEGMSLTKKVIHLGEIVDEDGEIEAVTSLVLPTATREDIKNADSEETIKVKRAILKLGGSATRSALVKEMKANRNRAFALFDSLISNGVLVEFGKKLSVASGQEIFATSGGLWKWFQERFNYYMVTGTVGVPMTEVMEAEDRFGESFETWISEGIFKVIANKKGVKYAVQVAIPDDFLKG